MPLIPEITLVRWPSRQPTLYHIFQNRFCSFFLQLLSPSALMRRNITSLTMVNNKEMFNIINAEHNEQNFRRKWGLILKIESWGINMPSNNYILTGCIHQGTPIFMGFGGQNHSKLPLPGSDAGNTGTYF